MESTVRGNSEPHVGYFNQELLLVQDLKHQYGVDARQLLPSPHGGDGQTCAVEYRRRFSLEPNEAGDLELIATEGEPSHLSNGQINANFAWCFHVEATAQSRSRKAGAVEAARQRVPRACLVAASCAQLHPAALDM
ncbi:hypothetical protein ACCO45_005454 [Purpureocillium lilacinum]|uniref:Uncharacterized protein n=1 Tax=Purpureocillium lilacinum TaxID=33203 RepID=A0ACC4DVI2_PURLI